MKLEEDCSELAVKFYLLKPNVGSQTVPAVNLEEAGDQMPHYRAQSPPTSLRSRRLAFSREKTTGYALALDGPLQNTICTTEPSTVRTARSRTRRGFPRPINRNLLIGFVYPPLW